MPSNTTQLIVGDVVDIFYTQFGIFPLRNCFESLADSVLHSRDSTLDRIVGICKEGPKFWSECERSRYNDNMKERARKMQGRRTGVKIFSILDRTALQIPITSTNQYSDEITAKSRAGNYDEESRALRMLQAALPCWQKQMPAIALLYLRATVKVIQRRMFIMAGNDSALVSVWESFVRGSMSIEIDSVCDKLEHYFETLREFVQIDCYAPEIEDTEGLRAERSQFQDCLKMCRSLVHALNNALPITYAIDSNLRSRLQHGWTRQSGQDSGWQLNTKGNSNDEYAVFTPSNHSLTSSFFTSLIELHEIASESSDEMDVIANCQISVLASTQLACSLIAKRKCEYLSSFGQMKVEKTAKRRRTGLRDVEDAPVETMETEMIRNIYLQADIFCLWSGIVRSDAYLDDDLVKSDQFGSTEILRLSDEWYDHLFERMIVPDVVLTIMATKNGLLFAQGCSRLLKAVQKKKE